MRGLFHLDDVPKMGAKYFASDLQQCIRKASATSNGRDIPLEDFYFTVISFAEVRERIHIVRFSSVNSDGKPSSNAFAKSLIQTLTITVLKFIEESEHYFSIDKGSDRYDYFYNPQTMLKFNRNYLYVPDNEFVKTIVVVGNFV